MLLAIPVAQRASADQFDKGTISGNVSDLKTGLPIAGARVALQRYFGPGQPLEMFAQPTATDPGGQYRFADIVPGRYAVIFYVPGYEARRSHVRVVASQGSISDVALKPLVTVDTTVTVNHDGSQNVVYTFTSQSRRELTVAVWGYGCTVSKPYCNPANSETAPADTTSKSRQTLGVRPLASVPYSFTKARNDAFSAGISYCVFTTSDRADAGERLDPKLYRQSASVATAALQSISFDIASWPAGDSDTHPCRTAVTSPAVDWP
jgi:hypothetical protein